MKKNTTNREENIGRKLELLASMLSGEEVKESAVGNSWSDDNDNFTADMWKAMDNMRDNNEIPDVEAGWQRLYGRLRDENLIPGSGRVNVSRVRSITYLIRIAASVLIIAGLGIGSYFIFKPAAGIELITASSFDERNVVIDLPDGSRVTLNRESTLTYPSEFENDARTVTLSGEGLFEVSGNQEWPFRVKADKAEVVVLGTTFNVKTRGSKEEVEVFVSSGRVLLTTEGDNDGIILTEGFIGTATPGKTGKSPNTNPNYLSWSSGILQYDSTALSTVFDDLNRVYGINIETADESIQKNRITTVFNNVSEEEIISIICTTFNLSWRKDGIVYIFSR